MTLSETKPAFLGTPVLCSGTSAWGQWRSRGTPLLPSVGDVDVVLVVGSPKERTTVLKVLLPS